ncbi:hypothetical protein K440DRAFT_636841 [Wilcoxina mikolae CBS 423.85]|nr:hypothetical protein K440DRAFT_636841 [Wilcoxina mikolae CBS 423.85]
MAAGLVGGYYHACYLGLLGASRVPEHCTTGVDPDLAGVGIRISTLLQGGAISAIMVLGLFHTKDAGIKEIGICLMLSQLAFAITLCCRMAMGTLNHVDAIIGLVTLDVQLAAVSMLVSAKRVLAARWMVWCIAVIQLVGYVVLGFGMGHLNKISGTAGGCENFGIVWFGYIRPLGHAVSPEYWFFYTWRTLSWVKDQYFGFRFMNVYHEEEKKQGATLAELGPGPRDHLAPCYRNISSTTSLGFISPAIGFWLSAQALEGNIARMNLSASSQWQTTGQSMALILAIGSVSRVLWCLWESTRRETSGRQEEAKFFRDFGATSGAVESPISQQDFHC